MFEFAEECSTSSAYESFKIGIEMCVRITMVTLTFDSFLRSDRSSRIYNSHFSFLLLMVMEIYIVLLRYILLPFNIRRLIFCCCSFSGNLLIVLFENLVCSFCCSYKVEICWSWCCHSHTDRSFFGCGLINCHHLYLSFIPNYKFLIGGGTFHVPYSLVKFL